jgi:hypothetical protein
MGDKEGDIKKKQYLNKHELFIVKQIIKIQVRMKDKNRICLVIGTINKSLFLYLYNSF